MKHSSFDIGNMYSNIPKTEVKNIKKEILDNNHTPENKKKTTYISIKQHPGTKLLTI
jgi:hypothetical protein